MTFLDKINETAAFLKDKGIQAPEFGLILGSGLGDWQEKFALYPVDKSEFLKLQNMALNVLLCLMPMHRKKRLKTWK